METATKTPRPHIGRKISRIRELRGMKQEALAYELGITQQAVSKIEQSETVEEEILDKIGYALGVSRKAIESFNEDALFMYIEKIENLSDNAVGVMGPNYNCTFNPVEKIVELYERLLASEREKVELLKGQDK
ncbi:MAG: helix-turn-helix transcriptional regulator [Marinoscillum sp.]